MNTTKNFEGYSITYVNTLAIQVKDQIYKYLHTMTTPFRTIQCKTQVEYRCNDVNDIEKKIVTVYSIDELTTIEKNFLWYQQNIDKHDEITFISGFREWLFF